MSLFRRAIRFFLVVLGLVAGFIVAVAAFFARYMIRPPREELWAVPSDAGLPYEEVEFPARDGLRLSGWLIPAGGGDGPQPTVILVHGWPWNRLGASATDLFATLSGALPVDLLRLAHALHQAGYHVLTFDLRNHGQSAENAPVTFGLREANDLLGALDYLSGRDDVDQDRIGTVGFSMGGNAVLFTLPQTDRIRAAVAVQPTSAGLFSQRFAQDLLGPLAKPVVALVEILYQRAGGMRFSAVEPVFAAAGAGETPIFFVQGKGDRWGSVSNVAQMASQTPNAVTPLFVDSSHRFGGYRHVVQNPELVTDFFAEQMEA